MKRNYIIPFLILAISAISLTSCFHFNLNEISGSGNVITENRTIEANFTSIEVNDGIEVSIEQADDYKVTVEADDNLLGSITTEVKNGVLNIKAINDTFDDEATKIVHVKMPIIEELHASSCASITNSKTINCNTLSLRTSSAGTITLKVQAEKLSCRASSGSEITLSGLAIALDADASSGSDIDTKDLPANTVIAEASSGSDVRVNPIVELKAKASSGSSITYVKQPKQIERKSSSGASIEMD